MNSQNIILMTGFRFDKGESLGYAVCDCLTGVNSFGIIQARPTTGENDEVFLAAFGHDCNYCLDIGNFSRNIHGPL